MRQLTTLALIGIAYFAVVIIVLHFLRSDLDPLSSPTSEYAVGSYGFLMTSAFLAMSIASLSLLIGLRKSIPKSSGATLGLVLLGIWGVGVLIAMSFPINSEEAKPTLANIIHRINGPVIFLSLTIATILISRSFRQDENWRPIYRPAFTLSLAMVVLFIVTGVNVATKSGFEGLCQRVFLILFISWFIMTTLRLRLVRI
jgi:hypothetical protein